MIHALVSEPAPNFRPREVHEGPAWCSGTCAPFSEPETRARTSAFPEIGACKVGALRPRKTGHSQPRPAGKSQCVIAAWNLSGSLELPRQLPLPMVLGISKRSRIPRDCDSEPALPAAKGIFIWALQHPQKNRLRLLSEREVRIQLAFL